MREAVAIENGFTLYRHYSEKEAARLIQVDPSTLKRWRRKALTPYVRFGVDGIRYLGVHIADLIIKGTGPWDDTPAGLSKLALSGSDSGQEARLGTDAGEERTGPSALASARRILKKQSSG